MRTQFKQEELPQFFDELEAVFIEGWEMLIGEECILGSTQELFHSESVIIMASVALKNRSSYQMNVWVPLDTATSIARYFYGYDVEDIEEIQETVGEMANIFAGNILSLLPGDWDMGLPTSEVCERTDVNSNFFYKAFNSTKGSFAISIVEEQ